MIKKLYKWLLLKIKTTFNSNTTSFERFQVGLVMLIVSIITTAIISIANIICTEKLVFSWTKEGWEGILNIYEFPLKAGAVALALITIWITLERTKLTEISIKNIADNNKFNNYYKHKELFKAYMLKTDIYYTINHYLDVHEDVIINRLYNYFYYKSYKEFTPSINKEANIELREMLEEMSKYRTEEMAKLIGDLVSGKININIPVFKFKLEDMIGKIYQKLKPELYNKNKHSQFTYGFSPDIFYSAIHCYVKLEMYEDVLGFDGEAEIVNKIVNANFRRAINHYLKAMALNKKLRFE